MDFCCCYSFVYCRWLDGRDDICGTGCTTRISYFGTEIGQQAKQSYRIGTAVLLNACSKLTYSLEGWNDTRDVRLEGEAIFDVVHKKDQPFMCIPVIIMFAY
mgnify:CR=1 FL=1